MTDVLKTKAELRAARLAARDAIPAVERIEKSLALASHGAEAISIDAGAIVSGFLPIRSEVDVRPLMAHLRDRSARLCVPVILDKKTIIFRELVRGAEPGGGRVRYVRAGAGSGRTGASGDAGAAVGLRCCGTPDRLWRRLLRPGDPPPAAKGLNPKLIGIAFDCQEVASVPIEPHDIRLDAVLTESGYRPF